MRALLDVNVLIALFDPLHVHNEKTGAWMREHGHLGWASCALTVNGCARIMSNAKYPNSVPLAQILARLAEASATPAHLPVHCDVSLLDSERFDVKYLLSASQLTDTYLLGLAAAHDLRLVTFDSRIALRAVRAAKAKNLLVL